MTHRRKPTDKRTTTREGNKQQGPQQKPQTYSQGQQAKDNELRKEGETTQRQERREHKQQTTERKEAQKKMSNEQFIIFKYELKSNLAH